MVWDLPDWQNIGGPYWHIYIYTLPITHGIPQGAIPSPLLFFIYISDLPLASQVCNRKFYVDDSKIFLSFPVTDAQSAERVLEEDLRRVAAWCCKNQLLINPEKTKFLMIGTQQLLRRLPNEIAIFFLRKEITPVSNAKDLGIILDSNLNYDQHIHQLTSSCMTKLCQINGVKNSYDRDTAHDHLRSSPKQIVLLLYSLVKHNCHNNKEATSSSEFCVQNHHKNQEI